VVLPEEVDLVILLVVVVVAAVVVVAVAEVDTLAFDCN
jgi:hypothetical protein